MRNPTNRSKLASSTVSEEMKDAVREKLIVLASPPTVGDNSGISGHILPLPADTHRDIESTLAAIAANEQAVEYARQKLAHLLWDRHDQMVADKPAGSVPFAHDLAINMAAQIIYLDALVDEFVIADSPKLKAMTPEERTTYRTRTRRRLSQALELFVRLAWVKTHNPDKVVEWNADAGRWSLFPGAFVPPGFKAGGDLATEKVNGVERIRESVLMESNDANEYYFISKNKGSGITINLSLDQFHYAFGRTRDALQNPTQDASGTEGTPARQTRAARQAAAKTEAEAKAAAAQADVDTTDSDAPEADALSGDRAHALGQLTKMLVSLSKWINHDTLANLSWSDLSKDAVNALTEVEMMVTRMNAKPDGKVKSKPTKLAA